MHPSGGALQDWLGLFASAFALKILEVVHVIFMQCMVDVFFIDWERSRGVLGNSADASKSKEVPVSIWRTYFVANEWNEIQTIRKINKIFQIFAVVFFLVVVGFENTTTKDPDGNVNKDAAAYKAEYSSVYRYGVSVLVYMIIGRAGYSFVYEFCLMLVYLIMGKTKYSNIGIQHGFSCINIRQVPWEVLKTEAEGGCFQHLPRDLANVNALKNHVRSLLLHKN